MEKNKIGKYFKYAIGEIVLVVIGILIALSLNNWNQQRKDLHRKETQLNALRSEFIDNLEQLNNILSIDQLASDESLKLMKINLDQPIEVSYDSLRYWLGRATTQFTFNPKNGGLKSAIASGEIHLIRNDSLVDLLFGWEDKVIDAREDEQRAILAVRNSWGLLSKYVRKIDFKNMYLPEIGKSKFKSDYHALIRDPLFEDFLAERYTSMFSVLEELNDVKKENVLILKLIDLELAKN